MISLVLSLSIAWLVAIDPPLASPFSRMTIPATIYAQTLRASERYPTASAMFCGLMSS